MKFSLTLIQEAIRSLRWNGVRNTLQIAGYSRYRSRLDAAYRRTLPPRPDQPTLPGPLQAAKPVPRGAEFTFSSPGEGEPFRLEVIFLAPDLARLTWQPGTPTPPYALAPGRKDPQDWPEVAFEMQEILSGWELSTTEMKIRLDMDGSLYYLDAQGQRLRHERPPQRWGEGWAQVSEFSPEECLFGLGEQAGRLNQRGQRHRLWNSDPGGSYGPDADPLYMPLPVLMSLRLEGSSLVFFENSFPASVELDTARTGLAQVSFEAGLLRSYFFAGPPPRLLERYSELTGRPNLPPQWSLGYHQCRWGYKTAEDIRQVAYGFRQHDLPLSAIHLDIDYMDGFRVFTVNPERFPDLAGLAGELAAQGVRLVTIIDPGVKCDESYPVCATGLRQGSFLRLPDGRNLQGLVWPGPSFYPDLTDPDTRRWWGEQYRPLAAAGVSGFWHDMNEPAAFAANGDMTIPLAAQHHLDGQGGDHRQGHNLYALEMNAAGFEGLRRLRPERRPWLISRSGWAGQQRYAWNWTGDTESTWAGLRMTIPTVLGLGLSGQPFVGPDIGGFSGSPSAELFLRSFQMSALLPFFRTHSSMTSSRREPWLFGEPYLSIIRDFLRLRYRLMPYLYTLAWQASQTGLPLVRPLWWAAPEQNSLWTLDDAFLLGEALLVAPVLEEGATQRSVTLPPGGWYDFWSGARLPDGPSTMLPAGLDCLPLLVHLGSLLPLHAGERLELHVYAPGADQPPTGTQLYSDAGDGYGPARVDHFRLAQAGAGWELDWDSTGDFPFPYAGVDLVLHGLTAKRAEVDGVELAIRAGKLTAGPFRHLRIE